MTCNLREVAVAASLVLAMTAAAGAKELLTSETSAPASTPYIASIHLADVASREGIADIQVKDGQTMVNSIVNVAEGKTDIAPTPLILNFFLEHGRGPFSALGEEKGKELAGNLRLLYPYNVGGYGMFAHEASGIDSWEDLKGRKVFDGPPRGAALMRARTAISLASGLKAGEDYQGVEANWGQLNTILVDGSADAYVLPLTFPSSRLVTASAAGRIKLFSMPKEIFESDAVKRVLAAPGTMPFILKEEQMGLGDKVTLISEDGTFRAIGSAFGEFVNKDMDFELAKALTAAHVATLDELKARAPFAANVGFGVIDVESTSVCGENNITYHPGAVAAWEEAGFKVPDCAK